MNFQQLQQEVQDILELPRDPGNGPAQKVVRTIFTTMTKALRQGEKVYIGGLGEFKLFTRKATRQNRAFFYKNTPTQIVVNEPMKTFVKFIPTRELRRTLNHGH